ncbi:MAG: sulfotransferase, partial [Nitrospinae bacterium]|nr:sulfotransferase [Nitrospinota bacterium]
MLGAMLGAHSNGLCVPEMRFKFSALRRWEWDNTGVNTLSVLKWLQNHWRFKIWELDIDLCSVIPNEVTYREFIELIVKLYGEKAGKPTPKFWIDHTPVNIMYAWTIFNVFPDAKMVHIVRDGRAVAASVMPLDWGPNEIHRAAQFWVRGIAYG